MSTELLFGVVSSFISVLAAGIAMRFAQYMKKKQDTKKEIEKYIDVISNTNLKFNNIYKNINFSNKRIENDYIEFYKDFKNVKEAEIKITEKLITSYHEQAISQSKIQFNISIIAAIVGFGLIISSFFLYTGNNLDFIFKPIPGVIINAVAALFFKQASDIRKRATDLYDRLRTDNQKQFSVEIADSIEDTYLKSRVKAQIALHVAGLPKEVLEPVNPSMNDIQGKTKKK